jgi:hypothetical protein
MALSCKAFLPKNKSCESHSGITWTPLVIFEVFGDHLIT